jgi:hypothetical protein
LGAISCLRYNRSSPEITLHCVTPDPFPGKEIPDLTALLNANSHREAGVEGYTRLNRSLWIWSSGAPWDTSAFSTAFIMGSGPQMK